MWKKLALGTIITAAVASGVDAQTTEPSTPQVLDADSMQLIGLPTMTVERVGKEVNAIIKIQIPSIGIQDYSLVVESDGERVTYPLNKELATVPLEIDRKGTYYLYLVESVIAEENGVIDPKNTAGSAMITRGKIFQ